MDFFGKHRLVPHPHALPSSRIEVTATISSSPNGYLSLEYAVEPATSLRIRDTPIGRQEGLWKSTCFELFLRPRTGGYDEFNFAPGFAWDAYRFSDWREGMRPLPVEDAPQMVDSRLDHRNSRFPQSYGLDIVLDMAIVPVAGGKASVTAVIEEIDGTKSYWALRHAVSETPDFHHPACFALEVPSAEQP
jgi:hypothetical protein